MNRNLLKIAAALCVVALVACGGAILAQLIHPGIRYASAERYTAGGTALSDAVSNLDIEWIDGAVNLAYHGRNTVEIAETAPKPISGDAALRWWLDGDTLRIRYAKSGFFSFRSLDKALTVTLPEGVALESVRIAATSGDVNAPELLADDVQVSLTSGDLALAQSSPAKRVALSATSGDIRADLSGVQSLTASGTSANVRMTLADADEVSVSTTSGGIAVDGGDAHRVRLDSTSGDIGVSLTAFDDLRIEATSGDVTANLPDSPGYRAEIDTSSGSFDYAVPLTRDGSAYACGDGSAAVRIHTTSGDVRLNGADGR